MSVITYPCPIGSICHNMALFPYPIRRLIVRSHKVSKPWDVCLELSDCFEIWQAHRQYSCRGGCQISKQYEYFNPRSRAFETLRDFPIRLLVGYWNRARVTGCAPYINRFASWLLVAVVCALYICSCWNLNASANGYTQFSLVQKVQHIVLLMFWNACDTDR